MKIAVIYWTQTGNTGAMASAVAEGAREAGTAFLGAAYGYGAPGELAGEGSLGEAASPDGLRSYLFL